MIIMEKKPSDISITVKLTETLNKSIDKVQIEFFDQSEEYSQRYLYVGHYFRLADNRGPGGSIDQEDLSHLGFSNEVSYHQCKELGLFVANRELEEEFGLRFSFGQVSTVEFIRPNPITNEVANYQIIGNIEFDIDYRILKIKITLEGNSISRIKKEIISTNNVRATDFEVTSLYG